MDNKKSIDFPHDSLPSSGTPLGTPGVGEDTGGPEGAVVGVLGETASMGKVSAKLESVSECILSPGAASRGVLRGPRGSGRTPATRRSPVGDN